MDEKKPLIQITHGVSCEKLDAFYSEIDAIKFLKEILSKRLHKIDINVLSFTLQYGIRIYFNYQDEFTTKIFINELEAIEYLKSLYMKRLDLETVYNNN